MISLRARTVLAAALALASVSTSREAAANGRFPAANHLVTKPGEPSRILLRATFGFVYSSDRGKSWDWVCEKAIGYSGAQDPAIALTAAGNTVAGLFDGLAVADSAACGWTITGGALAKQAIVDVAVRPDAPHSAVALTGTNVGVGAEDAGSRFHSQVFATTDDGATWSTLGAPVDPTLIVETVDVAASDPKRLYVSAIRGESSTTGGALLVSTDGGASWTEHPVPLDLATERAPFIAAVDPTDADRVYVRTSGVATSRLLVTEDAGKTFREVFAGGRMLGFALSPAGDKVYLGGPADGLQVATRDALVFTKRSPVQIECLMTSGTTLYACSNEASGFIVGASEDEGATFAPLLHLHTVRGPIACAEGTPAAACSAEWPAMRDQLGVIEDAGATADASAPKPQPPAPASSCGCTAAGGDAGFAGGAAGAIALLAAALRRRARRHAGARRA